MKVGEYVRIKNKAGWCCIGKIVNINEYREPDMKYCIDIQGEDYIFVPEDMIEKSSFKKIDLIKVGDYVNGCLVLDIAQAPEKALYLLEKDNQGALIPRTDEYIQTIVTKEQFKSMEYKVDE